VTGDPSYTDAARRGVVHRRRAARPFEIAALPDVDEVLVGLLDDTGVSA
jgi:hypothetical protein